MWTGSPFRTRWPAAGNWVMTVPTEKLWGACVVGVATGGAGPVVGVDVVGVVAGVAEVGVVRLRSSALTM